MQSVLTAIFDILCSSAVYLLLGFALAGLLHVVLRRTPRFTELLAGRGGRSVVLAALLGAPLPLCSCGVVPVALTLRRNGASKGAAVSFLISCPETDIVSILLTYGLLGPVMAVFRPFAAVVTAIVAGIMANFVDRGAAADEAGVECASECRDPNGSAYDARRGPLWNALHFGFVRFFDDIIGSLALGVVLGGLITALLPALGLDRLGGSSSFVAMLVMLVIGIPMYVCATASTPIAAGLLVGGLSPGTALVFLLAGPATNIGSLLVLARQLGKTVLAVYLATVAVCSLLMGLWLDAAFDRSAFRQITEGMQSTAEGHGAVSIAGAVLLSFLMWTSFRRQRWFAGLIERFNRVFGRSVTLRQGKVIASILLLLAYAASGLFVVRPGERAVVLRFGAVTQPFLGPGLHYRWPYPIGRADVASVARVERVEIGFRGSAEIGEGGAESWLLTGKQDIIDIKWVVQYRIKDSAESLSQYLYGVSDPRELVRSAADSALRAEVGRRDLDTLLTADRGPVETAVRGSLQVLLDQSRLGVEVVHVGLHDVHAPAEVHWAFRDVASAAEDQMRMVNEASEYQERVVPQAEAGREKRLLAAHGAAVAIVQRARGRSAAFAARLEAYRDSPAVTASRLYLETLDAALPGLKKYVFLSLVVDQGVNLWWMDQGRRAGDTPPLVLLPRSPAAPPRSNEVQP